MTAMPYLAELLEAVKAELDASGLGKGLCYQGVKPGAGVAYDFGDGCTGMLWTRLGNSFACSGAFPVQDDGSQRAPLRFAHTVEIGLIRGIDLPDDAEPATAEADFDDVERQLAESDAIVRAVCGYFARRRFDDWTLGSYLPVGPDGAILGGLWTVTARRG